MRFSNTFNSTKDQAKGFIAEMFYFGYKSGGYILVNSDKI